MMNNTRNSGGEKTKYDKVDSLNAYIKYVLMRQEKMLQPYITLSVLITDATRIAQASGIKLEDHYVNQTVNGQHTIQQ